MSELFRIINGALRLDTERVRNYSEFLADKMEKDGNATTARRIRKMLSETDHELRPAGVSMARALPVDSESRFPLVEKVETNADREPPIVLGEEHWEVIREFTSIAKSQGQMESLGLGTSLSMLIYGPPGTGKSRLAREIAKELDLPLYVARLDGIISSFLGSTSKNIRALFDFASSTPCVLFLDEFDAIAKLRGDSQELGELKRVVNSFIQNLDAAAQHTIILAATNHEELLDSAIWRRFSYRLKMGFPNGEIRSKIWGLLVPENLQNRRLLESLADLSEGFSGSDISEICLRLRRRKIISGSEPTLADAFAALRNFSLGEGETRRSALAELASLPPPETARYLREKNESLYSSETLGQLLGVSKTTAHRWVAERTEDSE